jgi:hypothetical protein
VQVGFVHTNTPAMASSSKTIFKSCVEEQSLNLADIFWAEIPEAKQLFLREFQAVEYKDTDEQC